MIVNPREGALVRDPTSFAVIASGATVDETDPYFARAIADGDLVAADAAPSAPAADPAPVTARAKAVPAISSEE